MFKRKLILFAFAAASMFYTACNKKEENSNQSQNEHKKMEANKQLIMQAYALLNKGDVEGYGQLFALNSKNHGEEVGREGIKFVVEDIIHTFPDMNLTPVALFAEGDWVISRDILKAHLKTKPQYRITAVY
jgi:predicted SnoaL-like aldol condensation-catalyzing enzyme